MVRLPDGLRQLAKTLRGLGHVPTADMLHRAAELIERGETDPSLSAEMIVFSRSVAERGYFVTAHDVDEAVKLLSAAPKGRG